MMPEAGGMCLSTFSSLHTAAVLLEYLSALNRYMVVQIGISHKAKVVIQQPAGSRGTVAGSEVRTMLACHRHTLSRFSLCE
jgi:hypothetical protein